MVEIIPAFFTNNPKEIEEKLSLLENLVERIQVDIADGNFSPGKTIDPLALKYVETDLSLDFHLIVKEPIDWVEKSVSAGGERIIGQIEKMSNQIEFVGKVQEIGLKVGLAVDIDTLIEDIDQSIISDLDLIVLMSYKAGNPGFPLNPKVIDKIEKLNSLRKENNSKFSIAVDGGVTLENIKKLVEAGANEIIIGRRLFEGDFEENLAKFKGIIA